MKFTEYAENLGLVKKTKHVTGSSSYVETAMRKVTDPRGLNEAFRETDLRNMKKTNGMINKEIVEKLEKHNLPYEYRWDCDYAYAKHKNIIYKVYNWADKYKVLKQNLNNVLDSDFNEFDSINEVASFLEKGVL